MNAPDESHAQLAQRIQRELNLEVPVGSIPRILRHCDSWNTASALNRRRLRTGRHQRMEEALVAWASNWLQQNGVLTYNVLQARGQEIDDALGITDFQYSDRWVYRFCQRQGLAVRRGVGESASANLANVELARHAIPMVLAILNAKPDDVFNADETGLVFGTQPLKTLAFSRVQGVKRVADRITVMLCCNATVRERLKPMIVAKPTRPRCWRGSSVTRCFNPADYVHYFHNSAAWVTREIFNQCSAR